MRNRFALFVLILGISTSIISCKKDKDEDPQTVDYADKVLLWLDASDASSFALSGDDVEGWMSNVGSATALSTGDRFVYDEANLEVVTNSNGSLGVSNLGSSVHSFFLVGRILNQSSYSVILANSTTDDGIADTRYLIREHSTLEFGASPLGYFNGSSDLVNPANENLPGNMDVHLFYADVDASDVSNAFYLGGSGNGQGGSYAYKEVVVLKEALTAAEKASLVDSLLTKWNIN